MLPTLRAVRRGTLADGVFLLCYVKGFEVRRCRHNLPYTGQSCVSNLSHTLRKYLAFNIALVTRGNSGLHRLNSSLKSSDIPHPTQSPKYEIRNTKSLLPLVQTSSTWRLHAIKTWRTTNRTNTNRTRQRACTQDNTRQCEKHWDKQRSITK